MKDLKNLVIVRIVYFADMPANVGLRDPHTN